MSNIKAWGVVSSLACSTVSQNCSLRKKIKKKTHGYLRFREVARIPWNDFERRKSGFQIYDDLKTIKNMTMRRMFLWLNFTSFLYFIFDAGWCSFCGDYKFKIGSTRMLKTALGGKLNPPTNTLLNLEKKVEFNLRGKKFSIRKSCGSHFTLWHYHEELQYINRLALQSLLIIYLKQEKVILSI